MKRVKTLGLMTVLLLTLLAVPVSQALPGGEVENFYYDANMNWIGEKDILCGGYHYTWGVTTAAGGAVFRSTNSSSCETGEGGWVCALWDDDCVCWTTTDLTYCGL